MVENTTPSKKSEPTTEHHEMKGIYRKFATGHISLYPAGEFEGRLFPKGIKLKLNGLKDPIKTNARELSLLFNILKDDPEVRKELNIRFKEEQQSEKGF